MLRNLILYALLFCLSGCKLSVMVAEGGHVESAASGSCEEGSNCLIEITDVIFSETFTAIPKDGYVFTKWNTGQGFFCAESTNPSCTISLNVEGMADIAEAIVGSVEYRGYIMPVFGFVGIDTDGDETRDHIDLDDDGDGIPDIEDPCPLDIAAGCKGPIRDTVLVGGREWAQVDLFANTTWDDMNAICPTGVCNGSLNGYDMSGWKWASVEDMNTLFNFYIGYQALDPGPNHFYRDGAWASAFYADGWRPTALDTCYYPCREIRGFTRDSDRGDPSAWNGKLIDDSNDADIALTNKRSQKGSPAPYVGGWFYRDP